VFEVLSESGPKSGDEPVTYGSMIMLRHVKTGLLVLADSVGGGGSAQQGGHARHMHFQQHFTPHAGDSEDAEGPHGHAQQEPARLYTRLKNCPRSAEASSGQFYLRPR
jgi:hypothetical protein